MFKRIFRAVVIAFLIAILIIAFEVNFPKLNTIDIVSTRLPEGKSVKVLQISDLHDKCFGKNNSRLLRLVRKTSVDGIVITGDLVDDSTVSFDNVYSFVEELVKINANVYFVSGNHEWRQGDIKKLLDGLEDRGVIILNNSSAILNTTELEINICGVDDSYTRHDNMDKAMSSIDSNVFILLLSHSPDIVSRLKEYKPDLVLCGHTHGGQVRLPIIGAIIAPGQGYFPELDKGLFRVNEDSTLYIDSGVGTSVYPLRLLNRSQISVITISGLQKQ